MTITTDGIVAACSGLLVVFAVIGITVKLVLLPYLRDHLVTPVAEVREQVKNTHESNLREDIDDITGQLTALTRAFEEVRVEQEKVRVTLVESRLEDSQWRREHLAYSASIASRLESVEAHVAGDIDQN